MKKMLPLILAIVFAAGCSSVIPSVDKAYVPDIQLKDLADKMVAAVDPDGVYRASTSYYLRQDIRLGEKTVTYEAMFKSPNKFRTIMSMDNKILQRTSCNGVTCWNISDTGERKEISGAELDRLKLMDAMSSSKGTILDVFESVEIAGEAEVNGSPCYILICHPRTKGLEPIAIYVSKTDYLTRKIATIVNGKPYVSEIKKYALLKGVMVATESEMDINDDGKKDLMILTDYKLNLDIPDKEFE